MGPLIGETIGNYSVLSLLGSGGMGEVYLAQHRVIGTYAAIKVLGGVGDMETLQRFFNEARAVSKVKHAGTVKIFDVGFHGTRAYLVMELLEGESLSRRIKRVGRMSGSSVSDVGRQIASVLEAVHAAGITHRDLKPDNIYLIGDHELPSGERVKILDFGIAKLTGALSGNSPKTRAGSMGTPEYMAPEQWGNAGAVDGRADIYSFGCVLFAMLAGRPPFVTEGIGEARAKHVNEAPPSIRTFVPELPAELDALLARMLAKQPGERPTIREIGRAFENLRIPDLGSSASNPLFSVPPTLPPAENLFPSLALNVPASRPSVPLIPGGRPSARFLDPAPTKVGVAVSSPTRATPPLGQRVSEISMSRPRALSEPALPTFTVPAPTPPTPPAEEAPHSSILTITLVAVSLILGGAGVYYLLTH
jgi:serine/threonine-protein kinase